MALSWHPRREALRLPDSLAHSLSPFEPEAILALAICSDGYGLPLSACGMDSCKAGLCFGALDCNQCCSCGGV